MRAVTNPDNTRTIFGVSTDSKPTTTFSGPNGNFDIEQGDVFYETNTGKTFMWTGAAWQEQ